MSRSYRGVRPKADLVYSNQDVEELYRVCRNTLCNWLKAGLQPVDDRQPQLFRGLELKRFHDQRKLNNKSPMHVNEFKCLKCKTRVVPDVSTLTFDDIFHRHSRAKAGCPDCKGPVSKILNETAYNTLKICLESNTSLHCIDEEKGAAPTGIVTKPGQACQCRTAGNERIIHDYQIYARRFSPKTLDAHLSAIRDFETFHHYKAFSTIKKEDAAAYRDDLIKRAGKDRTNPLRRSTIRHSASHLKSFFDWLVQQDGYRRLNKTIGYYFKLPRDMTAKAIQPEPREFPTTEQVNLILSAMPVETLIQRRDKAIVAASFLFGTRTNATASLRIGNVNLEARKVYQDANIVRVKNSKSQTTFWFPLGEEIEIIVTSWVKELLALGCIPEDALFPPDENLAIPYRLLRQGRLPIEPWETDTRIRRAFREGCDCAGLRYFNPHSAKHYLKSIRDEFCKTAHQRKAWSYNMGHANEHITEVNYAKMTDKHRDVIFANFHIGNIETEEEKDLLLAYHDHQLSRGTPEFDQAEQLLEARRKRQSELNRGK